ncbi:hypothetical protein T05_1488 [Trichinella murrelli]|uniref:Uncharacterized protein n=1 Tax=Trichinella murrelli TaxID=144512 RepID=A0A0V0T2G7_9BILA|nr:hypothetical protein T05_1488 [Trichinella murrelli]
MLPVNSSVSDCHIYKYKQPHTGLKLHLHFFYNISRNTQSGNLGPSSLLFSNFSYIPILFLEKNRFYENFEISWAIDFAVFAFWYP